MIKGREVGMGVHPCASASPALLLTFLVAAAAQAQQLEYVKAPIPIENEPPWEFRRLV